MKKVIYSDELAPRRRGAWAIIIGPGDELELFAGESIPGKVAVVGCDYTKNGVWSHSTYRLQVAEGVRFLHGHFGFETGTFTEGLRAATGQPTDRWYEVANVLGVSLPVAQNFLRTWLKEAHRLDQVEADLASLDEESPTGAATVTITYGAPTRAARERGFWEWPVRILDEDGQEVGRVSPGGEPSGEVRILKRETSSGYGGGYVSLILAVPEGCRAEHGPAPGEKTWAEQEAEERLLQTASEWLKTYGKKAVHVATKEYPYGRARVLAYAESQGCPIPREYSRQASDLWEFLGEVKSLAQKQKK
ncbi:MAG: hypothetical protein BWX44_00080 [Spirochaetes bacterium ADurb.Bin001]|nr:MAG: hypothetical protein BWX44_00080 [Spirochaetes bacterium ADurb.Bin001]